MKGLSIEPESRRVPSYMEMAQRTGLKETYQKKWIHNEDEKPHSFYKTT